MLFFIGRKDHLDVRWKTQESDHTPWTQEEPDGHAAVNM